MNLPASAECQLVPQATIFTAVKFAKFLLGDVHFVQEHFSASSEMRPSKRVARGARLLEDFLLHEMFEAALFRHDGVPGDVLHRALHGRALEIHHAHALRRQHRDVPIGHEKNVARVIQHRGDVAGHEIFVLAEADHRRRAPARRHDFIWVARGENHQRVHAAQIVSRVLRTASSSGARLLVILSTRCATTSVSVSVTNLWPCAISSLFQFHVVFDDSVVHHHDFARAIAVRMRVFFGGAAVRRPARVADAVDAVERARAGSTSSRLRSFPEARRISISPFVCTTATPAES